MCSKDVGNFMKTIKKPLSLLLTLIMLAGVITVAPFSAFASATTIEVNTKEELEAACDTVNANGGEFIISLKADFAGHININHNDAVVTVLGNGHTLTPYDPGNALAYVQRGTLNLGAENNDNSALTLKGTTNNDNPGIIYVLGADAVCNMYDKVVVTDHEGNNYFGGGVTVKAGTFHMYGGTITNCGIEGGSTCFGGGVAVTAGGSFIMDGGKITDCWAVSTTSLSSSKFIAGAGGGVLVIGGSSFTMNGGEISGNAAIRGGGIALIPEQNENAVTKNGYIASRVTINGGTIKDNQASQGGGLYVSGYYQATANGMCASDLASGSYTPSGLFVNGGTITGNAARDGGGAFITAIGQSSTQKVQLHNAEISENSAVASGGGIKTYYYFTSLDIDGCTISDNTAGTNGGGVAVTLNPPGYGFSPSTTLKDTTVTGNTSGDRGAGVYYDAYSTLIISGADIIQDNTYNGKQNNLNIIRYKDNSNNVLVPVYVGGSLAGSQIGISDPTLWDDELEDNDPSALSEDYLTSGYADYNSGVNPSAYFTSDHTTWHADYSDVSSDVQDKEARLVRSADPIQFHVNQPGEADMIFRVYNPKDGEDYSEVEDGTHELNSNGQISEFYDIPKFADDKYVFAGWYYHADGDKDGEIPFEFDSDIPSGLTDVYAHWIAVDEVSKDSEDDKVLPSSMDGKYSGFELFGVQIRPEMQYDQNIGGYYYGGLRFVSSVSESLLSDVDALSSKTVNGNKVEYGFVTAAKSTIDTVANEPSFNIDSDKYKIQYKGTNVNGVDTTVKERSADNFNYVTNVDCTSKVGGYGSNSRVKIDHKNFGDYRLMTFVVNYTGEDAEADKSEDIVARAYLRYYDANGLLRTFYNNYGGTQVYGGCSTNYNTVFEAINGNIKTDVKK